MLRRLLATTLLLATACAPIAPPTQPPATASAVATVTVEATLAVPDAVYHPSRMSPTLGVADVMHLICYAETTTIAQYPYGLTWYYDTDAYNQCMEAKKI